MTYAWKVILHLLSRLIITLDYEFKKFPDSILGVACIVSARKCIGATPLWNPKLDQLTSYKYPQIKECFDLILS
jgi:hypothetical protein